MNPNRTVISDVEAIEFLKRSYKEEEIMKSLTLTILLAAVLTTTGGCTYWHQQGRSFDQADLALNDCIAELEKRSDMRNANGYEVDYIHQCMREKGYSLKTSPQLPTQDRRELAQMSDYWMLKGVAGSVE